MEQKLFNKIFGSLACIAVGDALGFPVHDMPKEEINKRYGGLVDRMLPAFEDDFIHIGYKAGQVTDDTILTLVTADIILQTNGKPTINDVVKSFSDWAQEHLQLWSTGEVFGDTTKGSLESIIESTEKGIPWKQDMSRGYATIGSSNGAVMRIAPAGLVNPGNPLSACEMVFPLIFPTHRTDVALSAACGQAAAVSKALADNISPKSVVEAAIKGAEFGNELGKKQTYVIPSASVAKRIELAAELVEKSSDPWEAALMIEDYIGSYLRSFMVEDSEIDKLFDGFGPFADFMKRIECAYAFGFISKEHRKDLNLIRKIRNHFAHHPLDAAFDKSPIIDWCGNLSTSDIYPLEDQQPDLKRQQSQL